MKRDMDLIREILLQIEKSQHGWAPDISIVGRTEEEIGYHCFMIVDGGLANGQNITAMSDKSPNYIITSLTWEGHDFLDASRDPGRWSKAKEASSAVGGMTLDVLKYVLTEMTKNQAMNWLGLS